MKVKFWRVFRQNVPLSLKYGGSLSMENIVATFLQNMFGAVKNAKNHKVNKTKKPCRNTVFFVVKFGCKKPLYTNFKNFTQTAESLGKQLRVHRL